MRPILGQLPAQDGPQLLVTLLDHLPDMVWVKDARTLEFRHLNRAGEELVGWTRDAHRGKTVHDFYPADQAAQFDAQDRAALKSRKLMLVPEAPIQTRTGLRWLRTKKVPILDARGKPTLLLGIAEDVSEQRAARERAQALESELTAIVENAREAIVSWDLDGQVVSFNPAAVALHGLSHAEAVGGPVAALLPAGARDELARHQQRLLAGETLPVHETSRLRAGIEIEVEENLFLVRDSAGRPARFASVARDLTELARLRRAAEVLADADRHSGLDDAPVRSPRMRATLATADIAARDPAASVLLLGETGTGKGWLARRIHARGPRAAKPFLEVNCASLSPQLAESELFGHERGAFTGALDQKRGLVEAAAGGTLFLDEIGELPLAAQAQLLTFLDHRQFRRVGGVRTLASDVRLLAATNVDLREAGERGTFRRDLYYRLSVLTLTLPALRERTEDLTDLAREILADLARRSPGRRPLLAPSALAAIQRHAWPGNVRELRNALERGLILSRGAPIELAHLPPELREDAATSGADLAGLERRHVLATLERHGGNRTAAARALGVGRSTLKRKLARWRSGG